MVRKLKHTDIGDIPVDWELQTFDETFRVLSNNTLSRENLNNRGGAVRNIHYGDILTKFPEVLNCKEEIPYVNELSLLSSSTQLLQDGDIVIADTAEDETVGKVTEVQNLGDSKLVAGLHTIPCRVKKGDFAPGWLGYYMNSNLFHNQILPYITGIKVSSISKGAISETLILVPPFDEQEKIVQSLNEVQLLMTAETKVVNKMKFVKNGCLSKMFPQKDATVPEMRLPGFTEAWEQRKFQDVVEVAYQGINTTADKVEYVNKGVPILQGKHITSGKIDYKDVRYLDKEKYEPIYYPKYVPKANDILLANIGTIGPSVVMEHGVELLIAWNIMLIRLNEKADVKFVKVFLDKLNNSNFYESIMRGNATKFINKEGIMNIEIPYPSVCEQQKIGAYFANLDHLITLHQCKCDKYSNIKKGMMSDLLTGKIRLV